MRKQIFTLLLALMALTATAQISTPAPSPSAKLETVVGLTDVHVEYSRPSAKGRTLFAADGLVPFGEVWRTGANSATKVTFGDAVTVGGQEVAAGSYAILTKPMADKWEVMFFPYEAGSWNSYVEKTPVVKAMATVKMGNPVESFTIDVQNYSALGADLVMSWGKTSAVLPIVTGAKKQVMANIERVMAGPSMNDYFNAAGFLMEHGDKKEALTYATKAVEMGGDNPRFWMVRRLGLVQEALGMKAEAKATFTKSMELAKAAGNMDYVRLNEKSLKMM